MTDDDPQWRPLAAELGRRIKATVGGTWWEAMVSVPRHRFISAFLSDDGSRWITASDPEWLTAVYSDESLITQLRPAVTDMGEHVEWATSSSTRPSLMAMMLEMLQVAENDTVLEIGTGTGYNSAILTHRLGDRQVHSIDIDAELVTDAHARLADLGYRPGLTVGDGYAGIPADVPYSRIIATCAVETIPLPWLHQIAQEGIIVADIRGELESSLVALRRRPGHATGRLTSRPGHFMWLRPHVNDPLRRGQHMGRTLDMRNPIRYRGDLPHPDTVLGQHGYRWLLQTAMQGVHPITTLDTGVLISTDDGSWCRLDTEGDTTTATHGGPRDLAEILHTTWRTWKTHHRPGIADYGITITDSAQQRLWLREPETTIHIRPAR